MSSKRKEITVTVVEVVGLLALVTVVIMYVMGFKLDLNEGISIKAPNTDNDPHALMLHKVNNYTPDTFTKRLTKVPSKKIRIGLEYQELLSATVTKVIAPDKASEYGSNVRLWVTFINNSPKTINLVDMYFTDSSSGFSAHFISVSTIAPNSVKVGFVDISGMWSHEIEPDNITTLITGIGVHGVKFVTPAHEVAIEKERNFSKFWHGSNRYRMRYILGPTKTY